MFSRKIDNFIYGVCFSILGSYIPSVEAHQISYTRDIRSGFYAGMLSGWSKMHVKIDSLVDDGLGIITTERKTNSDSGVALDAFIGFRYLFNCGFMPGVDLTASLAPHDIETRFSHDQLFAPPLAKQLRVNINRKAAFIPGAVFGWVIREKFFIFCKVGIGISQFKTTVINPNPNGESFSQTKVKYGLVPSLGIEGSITKSFSILATVSYEKYPNVTHQVQDMLNIVPGVTDAAANRYGPSIISGKIGFVYKL